MLSSSKRAFLFKTNTMMSVFSDSIEKMRSRALGINITSQQQQNRRGAMRIWADHTNILYTHNNNNNINLVYDTHFPNAAWMLHVDAEF